MTIAIYTGSETAQAAGTNMTKNATAAWYQYDKERDCSWYQYDTAPSGR